MTFQQSYTLADRLAESHRICAKFPDRIPIIVERSKSSKSLPPIDKPKFLAPLDLTIGQFMLVIRKRLQLSSEQTLYLLVNDAVVVSASMCMRTVFAQYRHDDGFLYVTYAIENTFGSNRAPD